jgi:hypothetical protein
VQRPCLWFIVSWVLFLFAAGIYVGIWAISKYAVTIQASPYYSVDYHVSPYVTSEESVTCTFEILSNSTKSTAIYNADDIKTPQAVALSLVFSWL